jgi:superfamily II DNA or RNA helicase
MTESAAARSRVVWIVVPREELLRQASESLTALGVGHGLIAPGHIEAAVLVHVVSSATLIRRWDTIRTQPDFVIIDEAHLHYRRQAEIQCRFPRARIVGVTASPERLDGRGLSDLYDVHVAGPGLRELTDAGYLVPLTYYAPPLPGLSDVGRTGYEYHAGELDALMQSRRVYGSAIDHYRRHADGRSTLVFTRSVAAAETVAAQFRAAGYDFEHVSAGTPRERRAELVERLRSGTLTGLVNCEIATYGLDVPRVSCLILLRPTLSKALQVQMIGRGLRTFHGKTDCVILDHVGILAEHGHPYAEHEWRFTGTEKQVRGERPDLRLRQCPFDFSWCEESSCVGCAKNTGGIKSRPAAIIDGWLREVDPPEATDGPILIEALRRNDDTIARARENPTDENVRDAVRLGMILGAQPLRTAHAIGMSARVLQSIGRACGYRTSWAWMQAKRRGLI